MRQWDCPGESRMIYFQGPLAGACHVALPPVGFAEIAGEQGEQGEGGDEGGDDKVEGLEGDGAEQLMAVSQDLVLLGLAGITDPPRTAAAAASPAAGADGRARWFRPSAGSVRPAR